MRQTELVVDPARRGRFQMVATDRCVDQCAHVTGGPTGRSQRVPATDDALVTGQRPGLPKSTLLDSRDEFQPARRQTQSLVEWRQSRLPKRCWSMHSSGRQYPKDSRQTSENPCSSVKKKVGPRPSTSEELYVTSAAAAMQWEIQRAARATCMRNDVATDDRVGCDHNGVAGNLAAE